MIALGNEVQQREIENDRNLELTEIPGGGGVFSREMKLWQWPRRLRVLKEDEKSMN